MTAPTAPWWRRVLDAIGVGLSRPVDALPDDTRREVAMWDAETVARYKAEHGGIAPPGAPHIDDDGTI